MDSDRNKMARIVKTEELPKEKLRNKDLKGVLGKRGIQFKEEESKANILKKNLKILAWNIRRGFFNKKTEIADFLKENNVDICGVIEADVKNVTKKSPPHIQGYETILPAHTSVTGVTRVLTFVKEDLMPHVRVREDLMNDCIPTVWLDFKKDKQKSLLLGFYYREWSPSRNSSMEAQLEALTELMRQIHKATETKDVILMGDMNLCSQKWNDTNYRYKSLSQPLQDCLAECGLESQDVGLTYFADHASRNGNYARSALDHVYVSQTITKRTTQHSMYTYNGLSDHLPIMATFSLEANCSKDTKVIKKRCFKDFDTEKFKKCSCKYALGKSGRN